MSWDVVIDYVCNGFGVGLYFGCCVVFCGRCWWLVVREFCFDFVCIVVGDCDFDYSWLW